MTTRLTALIVEDSPAYRAEVERILSREVPEADLMACSDLESARTSLTGRRTDLLVMDVIFPATPGDLGSGITDPRAGFKLLEHVAARSPSTRVVVLSGQDKQTAVDLLVRWRQVGDYLFKDTPWKESVPRIRRVVDELLEARRGVESVEARFVGSHPRVVEVRDMIREVGPSDATVLIQGESGTGKELVARALHQASGRWRGPFLPVNCAALTESLLESELFGHRKGAFTGALDDREGKFEAAGGGTLFLDEVGELPRALQPKLLRVLQEREVERLGENRIRKVDVRIVAATNRDLPRMVGAREFREDLYFRLDVFPLRLPPLRERLEDLPELLDHLRLELNRRMGRRVEGFDPEAVAGLARQPWPGNVRELSNLLERVFILTRSSCIGWDEIARWLDGRSGEYEVRFPPDESSYLEVKRRVIEVLDRSFFTRMLRKNRGQIEKTAQEIGYNRKDLRRKLQELGLCKDEFKENGTW